MLSSPHFSFICIDTIKQHGGINGSDLGLERKRIKLTQISVKLGKISNKYHRKMTF